NKKVKVRTFQVGDLVLTVRRPMVMTHKTTGKFEAKWEGPYVVEMVYSNEASFYVEQQEVDILLKMQRCPQKI
ncbi:hypothetical protein ACDT16_13725, partial [Staphylococcus aureus]